MRSPPLVPDAKSKLNNPSGSPEFHNVELLLPLSFQFPDYLFYLSWYSLLSVSLTVKVTQYRFVPSLILIALIFNEISAIKLL